MSAGLAAATEHARLAAVAIALAACTLGQAATPDDDGEDLFLRVFGSSAPAARAQGLSVDVLIQGARLGELDIEISGQQITSVRRDGLIALLQPLLAPDRIPLIEALPADCTPAELAELEIDLSYDPVSLSIELELPAQHRREWQARIAPINPPSPARQRYPAARNSAALNLRPVVVFDHAADQTRGSLTADGFMNHRGVALQGGFRWLSRSNQFQRLPLVMHHDRRSSLLRISLGELRSPGFANQPSIPLRGVSVSRNFDLDPYDPPFPGLLTPLLLESPTEIEVRVNQRVVDRFRLPAGPALLRDFPLGSGLNEVEIVFQDQSALERTLRLDGWFDRNRLGDGRQRFHLSLGQPWQLSAQGPRSNGNRLSASAAFEAGLNNRLTLGMSALHDGDRRQTNSELRASYGFRRVALQASLLNSLHRTQTGNAVTVAIETYPTTTSWQWQFSGLWRGADYRPFGITEAAGELLSLQGRLSRSLSTRWRFGLSHRYAYQNSSAAQRLRASLAYRASASLSMQITAQADLGSVTSDQYSLALFMSWRPGGGAHSVYAGWDTDQRQQAGWQYDQQSGRGGTNLGAFADRDPLATRYGADASLRSQRASVQIGHLGSSSDGAGSTRFSASTALLYADGQFGVTERAGDAFVLFASRAESGSVFVNPSVDDWRARSDRLGPAVVGNLTPYLERGFSLALPEAPLNLDPGDLQPVAQPEFLRGVVIPVGPSPASNLRFRVVDANGAPIPLISGQLIDLEQESLRPFFTNRQGEVRISSLAPGTYRVMLQGQHVLVDRVELTANRELTDLGDLQR